MLQHKQAALTGKSVIHIAVQIFLGGFNISFRSHQALGFTQPLTEMSTRNIKIMFLGSNVRLVRGADNLTAIYEPIV
jgi:hypothetical protein